MTTNFVHLRTHSEYSLVDGLLRIKGLVKQAAQLGMPAVGLTDDSNLFALVKFYKVAMQLGIKPILGADLWLENPQDLSKPYRLTLLAQNEQGYRHLTELISRAYQENQHYERALVQEAWLLEANAGLIMLSGARQGDVGQLLLADKQSQALEHCQKWRTCFADRYYLEIQRTGRPGDEDHLHATVQLAGLTGLPVVATNDVCFLNPEDFEAHEARVCIHEGRTLNDPRRERNYSDQQYLRSAEEMQELFADIPEALQNSLEIAKRCSVEVKLGTYYLPDYPVPETETLEVFFRRISHEGLDRRLAAQYDIHANEFAQRQQDYRARLDFELDIILQMGFPGYFLIVMDFIQWAKQQQIPVGPGRGSGAGSLVAYSLLITDLDPIQYDLLFERFLNPERVSMPDFDIDFCMDNRDRVIDYVAQRYGRDAVSQIITFGTMAAKAVVRDVARVQGKSYSLGDKLSKLIPFEVGMTLKKAYDQEEPLRDFLKQDDEGQEIWEMAEKLEGVTRNVGKHAGGVVIAPSKLTDFAPLYCDEDGASLVTQFDKNDVEDAGLVKFDFLGLRTLTIIDWAKATIDKIRAKDNLEPLDINQIPLADKASFKLLQSANTTAVFQLESRGMKDLIKRLQPSRFEDIIALVALFRPGPLQSGMVDDFINRKHGRAELAYPHPKYQHDCLQPILEPTYGIILYQEQVMQIAQEMAGYSLGGADLLRRAMGKKKPEEMAKQREIFMEGSLAKGFGEDLASNIFDLMEKFAGYGFNKSHSAAYALVSYQTAWLKTHYPAPFMAAVLTSDMQNTDKVVIFIEECRQMGLNVDQPDVNRGEFGFTVDDDGNIVYGLGAIKGVGEGPIESICEARKTGDFTSLFDFCARIDSRKVNKRVLEALIASGAMDRLGPSRACLHATIEDAVQTAEQTSKNQDAGMGDLFGDLLPASESADEDPYKAHRQLPEWDLKEKLGKEKETLGLYLTGHTFDEYRKEVRKLVPTPIVDLQPDPRSKTADRPGRKLVGLVVGLRIMKSKKGDRIAFVTLDDKTARIEVALFSDVYEQYKLLLVKDVVLFVEGEISLDDYSGGLRVRATRLWDIAKFREYQQACLRLCIRSDGPAQSGQEPSHYQYLASLFQEQRLALEQSAASADGVKRKGCAVIIDYHRADLNYQVPVRLGEHWRVIPTDDLLRRLRNKYGATQVILDYERGP